MTIFSYFYQGGVSGDGDDGGSGDEENSEGEMSDDESPLNFSSWNVFLHSCFAMEPFQAKLSKNFLTEILDSGIWSITAKYLETVVSIPSVNNGVNYSVNEERKIQECIADSLTKFGLKVDKWAKIRMV